MLAKIPNPPTHHPHPPPISLFPFILVLSIFQYLLPNEMQNRPNRIPHPRIIIIPRTIIYFLLFADFYCPSMSRRMDQKGKKRPWAKVNIGNGNGNIGTNANRLSLCDYYRELGVEPEYCKKARKKGNNGSGKGKSRKLPIIKIVPEIKNEEEEIGTGIEDNGGSGESNIQQFRFHDIGNYPSCQGYFNNCRPSDNCQSGLVCKSRILEGKCCKQHYDPQCPPAEKLGYSCLQKNPVNWCNLNSDCASNMLHSHICCPTGCGYNICISNIHQSSMTRRLKLIEDKMRHLPSDCPNPFLIRLNCVVSRPNSLCHSALECPTYDRRYPRRCCTSSCGVCLTKFNETWMIS